MLLQKNFNLVICPETDFVAVYWTTYTKFLASIEVFDLSKQLVFSNNIKSEPAADPPRLLKDHRYTCTCGTIL